MDPRPSRGLRIGGLNLASPLFLSPLAGYTNLPFRRVIRELGGAGLCTTDLVNARSLVERNRKALKLIESHPEDRPLAVQIFGGVPAEMAEAARFLEQQGAASVDINMGCPVPKVCGVGAGSAMMRDHAATAALVRGVAAAVRVPVTCKMRLGWDARNITAPDLARALADAGAAAVFVHGRTREQGFTGRVDLEGIRAVVEAVPGLPVIGNGDVTTPEAARRMFDATGCAGIGIGRGAFYNPWIFRHTLEFLETGRAPEEPAFEERVRVMERHLGLMVECFGAEAGCRMFRKVGPWYAKRFGPCGEFNRQITRLASRAEFDAILGEYRQWRRRFLDGQGGLLPRFRPGPLVASFMEPEPATPAAARREAIPVPAGPVDLW